MEKFTESFKGRRQPKFVSEIIESNSREGGQLHTENYAKVKNFFLDFLSRAGIVLSLSITLSISLSTVREYFTKIPLKSTYSTMPR